MKLTSANHNSREIADLCNLDIRTVNKKILNTITELGYTLNENPNNQLEVYGEFSMLRLYTPTGRLMNILVNDDLLDLVRTQFDVVTAYKLRRMLKSFVSYGGLIVNQLRRRYSLELILQGLIHVGLVVVSEESASGYRYNVPNLAKESRNVEAFLIRVAEIELVESEIQDGRYLVTGDRKTLFVYGETAKRLLDYLIEHELEYKDLYFSEV